MERKLASVQQVRELTPIEGADFIERATVEGWQCVVKKGEFVVGDLGVFFEIDAIPPQHPVFEWLWAKPKQDADGNPLPLTDDDRVRPEKFRIRTMKLRGMLSQGLLMPLGDLFGAGLLPEAMPAPHAPQFVRYQEGDDLTEMLGVEKYEAPQPTGMGDWRAPYPGVLSKTDEMRVQSVPEVLEELRGHPYVITLKCDGTSATFLMSPLDGEFHVCGRNHSVQDGANLYWEVARRYGIEEVLRASPCYALQGEIVGPGIQKNPMGLKEKSLFGFNVFDLPEGRYLPHDAAHALLQSMGVPPVPVIEEGDDFQHTQESLLALAEGKYPGTKNEREGIVVRAQGELRSEALGGRMSFKAISNRYLLKEE